MRGVAVAALALVSLAALAAEGKKDKETRDRPAGTRPAEKVVLVGTIQDTGGTSGKFVLRVPVPHLEANPKAPEQWKAVQKKLLESQDAILRIPDVLERLQELKSLTLRVQPILAQQKDVFNLQQSEQEVVLQLADDVKVRSTTPGPAFDDKGNIRRYTPKELRDLRGSDRRYPADRSDLHAGQAAMVQVAARRAPPEPPKGESAAPANGEDKLQVVLIVISK